VFFALFETLWYTFGYQALNAGANRATDKTVSPLYLKITPILVAITNFKVSPTGGDLEGATVSPLY